MRKSGVGLCCMLLVMLTVAPVADAGDRSALKDREKRLEQRIADLRQEQEYLTFRRVMEQSDSKYLILDLAGGQGRLKYRNRVLRSFRIAKAGGPKGHSHAGLLTLTEKRDPYGKKRMLVFGDDLVIQGARKKRVRDDARWYAIGTKDLAAVSFSLEAGALAYILR